MLKLTFAVIAGLAIALPAQAQQQPPATQPAEPELLPGLSPRPAAQPASPTPIDVEEPTVKEPEVAWGVGFRTRFVFLPAGVLELFLGHATPMRSVGFGGELIRRKGNFDIVIAVEYENISPEDGLYEEKGEDPSMFNQYPDYVHFDNFALLSGDVSFIWSLKLTDFMHFRYGAGIGLGGILGKFTQTDAVCDSQTHVDDLDDPDTNHCVPTTTTVDGDWPPIVPIVHLLVGLRFQLIDQLNLNVEAGFRDVFFAGGSIGYIF